MERIPGASQQEWDELPTAFRLYIEFLQKENAELKERVAQLEAQVAKNSTNSHKPPSSDGPAKPPRTSSSRDRSGKKPGGQSGHSGSTLKKRTDPDVRIQHRVGQCSRCNRDLSKQRPDEVVERQVFDLPPMKMQCTAHEAEVKHCPDCGTCNKAAWPEPLASEQGAAIYGPNVRSLVVYLMNDQLIPGLRTSQVLEDLFGQRISSGTLRNWNEKAFFGLEETDRQIADALAQDLGCVNFDETGVRSENKNHWLHSASNEKLTHFEVHAKRGGAAIDDIGILPRFKGTAIHDRWEPYFGYENCRHGLCGAHLIRDLRFVWEAHGERWAKNMKRLLVKMNDAVKVAKARGRRRLNSPTIDYWQGRYRRLLNAGFELHSSLDLREGILAKQNSRGRKKQRPGKNLLDALSKHEESVLLFLKDFAVPFTNNQSERDIRMTKVKIKVSGCFRSARGARQFCGIRGYISTAKKQGWNVLEALTSVFHHAPFKPIFAGI
jgi:transposase